MSVGGPRFRRAGPLPLTAERKCQRRTISAEKASWYVRSGAAAPATLGDARLASCRSGEIVCSSACASVLPTPPRKNAIVPRDFFRNVRTKMAAARCGALLNNQIALAAFLIMCNPPEIFFADLQHIEDKFFFQAARSTCREAKGFGAPGLIPAIE